MTLPDLIKCLEAHEPTRGTSVAPPSKLQWALWEYLDIGNGRVPDFVHSIDAVAALTKERLGDVCINVVVTPGAYCSALLWAKTTGGVRGFAKTESCARLIALLRAMEAEKEG